jgi:hypothetical protein
VRWFPLLREGKLSWPRVASLAALFVLPRLRSKIARESKQRSNPIAVAWPII